MKANGGALHLNLFDTSPPLSSAAAFTLLMRAFTLFTFQVCIHSLTFLYLSFSAATAHDLAYHERGAGNKAVNKDGRLIRLDYVFFQSQRRLVMLGNIISLIRTPRLLFLSFGFQGATAT
jgi:hypothetical protein